MMVRGTKRSKNARVRDDEESAVCTETGRRGVLKESEERLGGSEGVFGCAEREEVPVKV